MSGRPLLQRLAVHAASRAAVDFTLDGQAVRGHEGDTVLTAVLALTDRVRRSEADDAPRAGFCHMGACQDCWMDTADGRRLRACTTMLEPGLALVTERGR